MDIHNIIEFVKENLPEQSENLYSMLALLSETLADLKRQIADSYKILEDQDDERFDSFRSKAKEIKNIKNIIDKYIEILAVSFGTDDIEESPEETNLQTALDNAKSESEQKQILAVDYSSELLNTDRNREHSLYEDFRHTMPCAFRIFEQKIEADQWKILLLKFCEYLYDTNPDEFLRIADDSKMQGSSRHYISAYKKKVPAAQKMKNINLYVIGNISANGVRNYIVRLLSRFDIPKKNFAIFIRRDLSLLHSNKPSRTVISKEDNASDVAPNTKTHEKDDVKIGEFVRSAMQRLSAEKYVFPDNLLLKLTSGVETKKMFGVGLPFLKEYNKKIPISEQTKDSNGYNRYWKEVFEFNGHQYLIVSQWTKNNEIRIRNWLDEIIKHSV